MTPTQLAEFWLLISTLLYFVMNGAGIFETFVIIPRWASGKPGALSMLKDLDLKRFWIAMHSVHELTFIIAIYYCWDMEFVRKGLLIMFAIHFAVRVWTIIYFAPRIMEFQRIATSGEIKDNIAARTIGWKNLNYLRTGLFVAVSIGVLVLYLQLVGLG